jgi:hypothetical protein
MRLMRFSFTAEHRPGKKLVIADTLSRCPMPDVACVVLANDIDIYVNSIIQSLPVSEDKLNVIRKATSEDETLSRVIALTKDGWPKHRKDVSDDLAPFFNKKESFSIANGLLLYGSRMVIPTALRQDMLGRIHDGHLGVSKCRERAKMSVWWPGLSKQIFNLVHNCQLCHTLAPAQRKEPLQATPLPPGPWQKLGMDIATYRGSNYLVVTDYFSRWLEILLLSSDTSSSNVIAKLTSIFARFGVPLEIVSDNGPQFSSQEFAAFLRRLDIKHATSSPYFPTANGAAERAVQTAKRVLSQKEPWLGLLVYRNTPNASTGFCPSELLMGRRLKDTMPLLPPSSQPK